MFRAFGDIPIMLRAAAGMARGAGGHGLQR
jgi:hypothetical protein